MSRPTGGMGKVNAGVSTGAEGLRYGDHDPTEFESDRWASPERALYLSVVIQAWQDAFAEIGPAMVSAENKPFVRAEARRWFVSPYESEDRRFVIEAAGLSSEWIERLAKERLAAERDAEAAAKVIRIDSAFVLLVRQEADGISPEQVTAELERIAAMEAA